MRLSSLEARKMWSAIVETLSAHLLNHPDKNLEAFLRANPQFQGSGLRGVLSEEPRTLALAALKALGRTTSPRAPTRRLRG